MDRWCHLVLKDPGSVATPGPYTSQGFASCICGKGAQSHTSQYLQGQSEVVTHGHFENYKGARNIRHYCLTGFPTQMMDLEGAKDE